MEKRAIDRLTEREKDCLRRWLAHQTAKEIALDLGISPHAVEKRLKMARAKLGVSSSLDAARLLAETEGYQQAGPQSSDLAPGARDDHRLATGIWPAGGIVMSLIVVVALAVALQPSGSTPAGGNDHEEWTPARQVESVVVQNFARLDKDRSGFIEPGELPDPTVGADKTLIAKSDRNGDGKVDLAEYRGWLSPILVKQGAVGRKLVEKKFSPAEFVKATPAEILVIVQSTFHTLDRDRSDFLSGDECPMVAPKDGSPVYKRGKDGKFVPTGEVVHQTRDQLCKTFFAQADIDGDGKVSFEEYRRWDGPSLARQGIPAEWKADIDRPVPTRLPGSPDPG